MAEQTIIPPVSRDLLKKELSKERFVRYTRKGENEIYVVNYHNAPNILREIGRLREEAFRSAGGGTGKALDIDELDTCEQCYQQLIVWDPQDEEIISGYRFIKCADVLNSESTKTALSTEHYFTFEDKFVKEYLPKTIELGRSWVQTAYQPMNSPRKGLFALDNIWDGLGIITVMNPDVEYFFGKATMYPHYNLECKSFLLHFMHYYFPDDEQLMTSKYPLELEYDREAFDQMLGGLNFKEGFKVLNQYVRERKEIVPPLVNIYMHLSPTMKTFGTAVNPDFGGVEEIGIMVKIKDIYEDKKTRHIESIKR
ncbi:GNAT family N-acetyltransferase [Microscilla marina]|uniref:Hemolysin A n=1 Tax=Microscilla marina ATCC 23134 TaxID=313606 RepID=A1ZDP9_MICM2|nr:GNAT family N-acetyltransferase [Microscilla marina]EAY31788.1 hemolysin A [Microscilla marina ATCC 23134]